MGDRGAGKLINGEDTFAFNTRRWKGEIARQVKGNVMSLTFGFAREGDKTMCEELSPVSEEDSHLLFEQL